MGEDSGEGGRVCRERHRWKEAEGQRQQGIWGLSGKKTEEGLRKCCRLPSVMKKTNFQNVLSGDFFSFASYYH